MAPCIPVAVIVSTATPILASMGAGVRCAISASHELKLFVANHEAEKIEAKMCEAVLHRLQLMLSHLRRTCGGDALAKTDVLLLETLVECGAKHQLRRTVFVILAELLKAEGIGRNPLSWWRCYKLRRGLFAISEHVGHSEAAYQWLEKATGFEKTSHLAQILTGEITNLSGDESQSLSADAEQRIREVHASMSLAFNERVIASQEVHVAQVAREHFEQADAACRCHTACRGQCSPAAAAANELREQAEFVSHKHVAARQIQKIWKHFVNRNELRKQAAARQTQQMWKSFLCHQSVEIFSTPCSRQAATR